MAGEQPNFFDIGDTIHDRAIYEVALSVWLDESSQENEEFTERLLGITLQELGKSPAEIDHIVFATKLEALTKQLGD
jgi:hypothetical protein